MNKLYKFFLAALLLTGCTASDTDKANSLLEEARLALQDGQYDRARNLVDSLRSTYPKEFDVRRSALAFADSIELAQAKYGRQVADSVATFKNFELDDLKKDFTLEKQEKYQSKGYYVTNDYAGSKSSYTYFTEVEEGGVLLAVSISRSAGIRYDFQKVDVDLNSEVVPACPISRPLTEKEQISYEKCYRLAKCMNELSEANAARDKFDVKVRFFERKLKEGK